VRICARTNRQLYRRAKDDFVDHYTGPRMPGEYFWEAFGEANGMRVIIPEWRGPYPVVEALEFNTEADYAWFMLRYS